ncbi:Protein PHLOEM PROTEIN 2-LIKE A1 [Morella rubra]|uniref:Protein PHLOEM PROTEIN 2-LIKE A1 n=1 Tax=Morella rubra TaxID=262757 RepID=A0A6A1VNP7_9ROSI|nr:Protein PHLOEM PROTEIN 2-LIKE A1 [Morella rubra]
MEKKGATDLGNNAMSEEFLEPNKKKKWIDKKNGYTCFELYARSLYICWGETPNYWTWDWFKETRLTDNASGWKYPITLQLSLPDRTVQQRQVSLSEKPRKQWIELNVGSFKSTKESGEVGFDIQGWHGGLWKNGLIRSRAILRPKQMTL